MEYTVQNVSMDGINPTFDSVTSSDTFLNDGRTVLIVKNGGSSDITVTITDVVPCNYGFMHDLTVTVAAGEERWIGVFPVGRFNDNGYVTVDYSDTTNVTAAAVRI